MRHDLKQSVSPLGITRAMVWVTIVGYGVFLVGMSTYQNYEVGQEIKNQKIKIGQLEKLKRNLELSLVYYRSNSFKEIEARRRLFVKGKDEFVVAMPMASSEPSALVVPTLPALNEQNIQTPPYKAWWELFFKYSND